MPVPKRKKSKSKRDMRRATHKLKAPAFNLCPRCNSTKLPHHVCINCGFYRDREIIAMDK